MNVPASLRHGDPWTATVAVVPFANAAGDPDQDYLAGIAELLIAALSTVPAVRAIGWASMRWLAGSGRSPSEIAALVSAEAVITGVVRRRSSGRAAIEVRLLDATTEREQWSRSDERDLGELPVWAGEITAAVLERLEIPVDQRAAARLARPHAVDADGCEAWLRGSSLLSRYTPEGMQEGLASFKEAIELDPESSLAYASLAAALSDIVHLPAPPLAAFPAARAAARRALELEAEQPLACLAMAEFELYHGWDLTAAGEHFQRAIELAPGSARAQSHYGWYLDLVGESSEAVRPMERAIELDPFYPVLTAWLGWWHWWCAEEPGEAIVYAQKSLEVDPALRQGLYVLGGALAEEGRFEAAIEAHRQLAALGMTWPLGETLALAGERAEAERIAAEVAGGPSNPWGLAQIQAALGQEDGALASLEAALAARFIFFPWLRKAPRFRRWGADARLDRLLQRARLEPR